MLDTSFVVARIAYHAFFEQTEFKCLLRDDLFEIFSFPTQFLHLVSIFRTRRVPPANRFLPASMKSLDHL
jgi:hypothetical protein